MVLSGDPSPYPEGAKITMATAIWSSPIPHELHTVNEHWAPERQRITETYLTARTAVVQDQLAARGWWPE